MSVLSLVRRRGVPALAALLVGLAAAPASATGFTTPAVEADPAPASVTLVDLGVPGTQSGAFQVTESGFVFGNFQDGSARGAFRWKDGVLEVLPGLDGGSATAEDINEAGQVVGSSMTAEGVQHAMLWQPDGTVVDLGEPGTPGRHTKATSINGNGTVVGTVFENNRVTAVIWRDGVPTPLLDLPRTDSAPSGSGAINDRGQVAINSSTPVDNVHELIRVFLWEDGAARELPIPEGLSDPRIQGLNQQGGILGQASGTDPRGSVTLIWTPDGTLTTLPAGKTQGAFLNDRGEVVGRMQTPDGRDHAFVYRDGTIIDLGGDGSIYAAGASSINGLEQVVGYVGADPRGVGARAALWDDGPAIVLPGLDEGGDSGASDINDRGQIVGSSTDAAGVRRAVMWTLEQEPAAVVPVLTDVDPAVGLPGSTVTITGTGFSPVPTGNHVTFGTARARVLSATPTVLRVLAPEPRVSSKIRVRTAGGTSTTRVLFMPPAPYEPTDVGSHGSAALGSVTRAAITEPRTIALTVFGAQAGQVIGVEVLKGRVPARVTLLRPDGTRAATASLGAAGGALESVTAPATGVYTVVVDPHGAVTGTVTLRLRQGPPETTGAIERGVTQAITTTMVDQNAVRSFQGVAGQRVTVDYSAVTYPAVRLVLVRPDGSALGTSQLASPTTPTGRLEAVLPTTGTYRVKIDPVRDATGSVTVLLQ